MRRVLPLPLILLALNAAPSGAAGAAHTCAASLPGRLALVGSARQLITVQAAAPAATSGLLETWQREGACWRAVAGPWPAWLGRNGVSLHHVEGDDTTPAGRFGLGPVVYGVAPDPGVRYPYHRLVCGDWWDEDPSSPAYNTFVHLACGARPSFGGASEALWRSPVAYAHVALIDYNTAPIVPGAGSAIFLHASIGRPTDGCVALPLARLDAVLRWLRPALRPAIVIGTAAELARL